MDWGAHDVQVDLDREAVKTSPPFKGKATALLQADEDALDRHYGQLRGGS